MSDNSDELVVLFKSVSETENEDDSYVNAFRSAKFQVTLIPVLDFEFVNLDKLLIKLKNPDDYEGIIFTSPRCVTGVQLSVLNGGATSALERWKRHKHFVVGEKTADMVDSIKLTAAGKEAGNAKNLVEIMSKDQYNKPFLYPKGSLTKDNFKLLLLENHIHVDDILIYRTKPHSELEANIEKIMVSLLGKTVYFIYFSPSGVNFTFPLFQKYQFDLNGIKFIAIGPTTEELLKEKGVQVTVTSSKPNPQALLDAILTYKKAVLQ